MMTTTLMTIIYIGLHAYIYIFIFIYGNINNNDNIVSQTSHNVDSYNTTYYLYSSILVEVVDIVVDEDINHVID